MKYMILFVLSFITISGIRAQKEVSVSYFNQTQAGFFIGEESEDKNQKAIVHSFQTINGIRFDEQFGLGIGVGAETFEYLVFPVFVSGTVFFNKPQNKPYIAVKVGHAFTDSEKRLNNYNYYGDFKHKGGLMFNPEFGMRFKMSTFDMTMSAGYRFQRLKSGTKQGNNYNYNREVEYNRVSFAIGIMF